MDEAAKNRWLSFMFCIGIICLAACYLYQQFVLKPDISSLLVATERLLQGGNYLDDFFTPNPPMILYLYIIPVMVAKFLQVSIIIIFPIYIFLIAAISFLICYRLINKIYFKKDIPQGYLFLSVLAIVLLIVPTYEFGQRDHLLVIMTMPYLLTTVCRLEGKTISRHLAIAVGILAGLGIAIKPQYLILPCLIEGYYLFYQRNWFAWIRPEILAMSLVQALYVIFVLITRQDYVTVMIPFLLKNYYGASSSSAYELLLNNFMLFVYASVPIYILLNRMNEYKKLATILFLALTAFSINYLLQGFNFFYHIIPAFSLAILMVAQIYINLAAQKNLTTDDYKTIASSAVGMVVLLLARDKLSFRLLSVDPGLFCCFFAMFFYILFSALKNAENKFTKLSSLIFIIPISYIFSYITLATMALPAQLILVGCMLLLLFGGMLAKYTKTIFILLLGILFFGNPIWLDVNQHEMCLRYKYLVHNKLIDFIHTQPPHRSIYVLTPELYFLFPLVNYTDVIATQRFTDGFWMFREFDKKTRDNTCNNKICILNMIVEDLHRREPDIIFVENNSNFKFFDYFLENKDFRDIWKNYHYLLRVGDLDVYKHQAV